MTTGLDMPDPGSRLGGRYSLLDRLGAGVTGEVWRGRDENAAAACAVKFLRPEFVQDEGALARLRATIAWISQLTHPGIVPVDDMVTQHGVVALVSRLVPGESLRSLLDRQGPVPTGAALLLTAELGDALAAARRVGVAHGDVKPANLLLEPDPETGFALRLTDFGMAALLGRAAIQQAGPARDADSFADEVYAAPELGVGDAPTEAADVYAAGVILFEALTGEPPFDGAAAPAALPADVPELAADALFACLDDNPRRRPSAAEFAAILRQAIGATQAAPQQSAGAVEPGPDLGFFGDTVRVDAARLAALEDGALTVDALHVDPAQGGEAQTEAAQVDPVLIAAALTGTAQISDDDLLPAMVDQRQVAPVRRTGAVVATHAGRSAAVGVLGTRAWTVVAAALCGVALAAVITFGLTTHGSPRASASTLPARVAVVGTVGTPTSQGSATGGPTGKASSTASATPSSSVSATPSATHSAPSSANASASASPAPSPSNSAPVVSHTGRLFNAGSSSCMDTSGGYYADGVVEQIWTCNSGQNQVFTLASTGQLTIDGGQYCLDDATSADATGTHPELFTCGSQSHQRWTMRSNGSIVGDHSGLCLNAPGNDAGTQLDFEPCDGQAHQLWSWD
jgi:serine/threonine-protein kinase